MKQTFVVEFTHAPSLDRVSELMLWDAIWKGLNPMKNNLPSYITVQEITVEQTCGTPDFSSEKALSLLKDACEHLSNSTEKYGINLSYRIEEYIRENTKET